MVATKRGAHLALSPERLDGCWSGRPAASWPRPPCGPGRGGPLLGGLCPVMVVAPLSEKAFDLSVVVLVEDKDNNRRRSPTPPVASPLGGPPAASIWLYIDERLVELIRAHRSTIVFANSRRLAERLCAHSTSWPTPSWPGPTTASSAASKRTEIEEDLKAGRLPAVVATSSLELGIDMGAVDLVVQVEAPSLVASGPQRIGRGRPPGGRGQPRHRLPQVPRRPGRERGGRRAHAGPGPSRPCATPATLDVLAQQIVAMVAMDDWEHR